MSDLPTGWPKDWPRKSKFDVFIMKGPKGVFGFTWDTSVDGIAQWRHTDGKSWWVKKGNGYRSNALQRYKLIQRLPEAYARMSDGGPGLLKCVEAYANPASDTNAQRELEKE